MADRQPPSETVMLLGGIGVIALVAYLASRKASGNVMQPITPEATSPNAPVATNSLAFDMTALPDPLLSVPSGAFGGSMTAPGQYVQLPSGTVVPFISGIDYAIGSIIHYADGSVQIL